MVTLTNRINIKDGGDYHFERIGTDDAYKLIKDGFVSGLNSGGDAKALSILLRTPIRADNVYIPPQVGDIGIVFPPDMVLKEEFDFDYYDLLEIGFSFLSYTRTA